MTAKLRFGVIGCGVIGGHHARIISSGLKEDAELVAVADVIPERADKFAQEHGAAAHYDYKELLARPDVDVVSICLPSGMHAQAIIDALEAGKHVVCEKPFDITREAMDRVLAAEEKAGTKLTIIHQNRFHDAVQLVKQTALAGKFGRLTYASAQVPWYRTQGYYDSGEWRGTWAMDGGGALMNQAVHTIDLMQWIMGPVVEVQAYTATLAHERIEVEDVAMAAVKFASGAIGAIEGTTAIYPGLPIRLTVGGDAGSAVMEGDNLTWLHVKQEGEEAGAYGGGQNQAEAALAAFVAKPAGADVADSRVPGGNVHQRQIQLFIDAIRQDKPVPVSAREARNAVAIILAIYESARTGRPVQVR